MEKKDAIKLFGGVGKLADALVVTRQTVHAWDDTLTVAQEDRVNGAYLRLNNERNEAAKTYFGWMK